MLKPDAKIGMNTSDIILKTNWGVPDQRNKYENRGYLYFENGKLTVIQTSR